MSLQNPIKSAVPWANAVAHCVRYMRGCSEVHLLGFDRSYSLLTSGSPIGLEPAKPLPRSDHTEPLSVWYADPLVTLRIPKVHAAINRSQGQSSAIQNELSRKLRYPNRDIPRSAQRNQLPRRHPFNQQCHIQSCIFVG